MRYFQSIIHITVKELAFLVDKKKEKDEISRDTLYALILNLQEILGDFEPFDVELKNLNNFISTVCIESHDDGIINNINGEVLEIEEIQKYGHDYPGFLPHLSIAQYKNLRDYANLIKYLEYSRKTTIGTINVDSFELVIAELPVKERFPTLKLVKTLHL